MRIIAGIHRGRQIAAPEGLTTRPMTDRVRENLFNLLRGTVADATVLDLFCGSGALGLEAMSRGAAFCLFVDSDRPALEMVEANRRLLRLVDRTRVVRHDCLRPGPWILPLSPGRFTLVFADPPYKMTADPEGRCRLAAVAGALAALGAVEGGAVAMLRMKRGTPMDAPWPDWRVFDERAYGSTTLHLMEYGGARNAPGVPAPEPSDP